MTVHDIRVTRTAQAAVAPAERPRHPLEEMNIQRLARRLVVYTPSAFEVASLLQRARRDIAQMTTNEVIYRVMSHNPDSFWAIARRDRHKAEAPAAEGFLAFLMLNEVGAQRLIDGSLDTRNPDVSMLTTQSEKPAAIYLWAGHARGSLAAAIPLVFEKVSTPLYGDVDIYSRAVTTDGHRALEAVGFRKGATFRGTFASHLYMYRRSDGDGNDAPLYDCYRRPAKGREHSVTVARTLEDVMRAMATRSAVYIAEQECPYAEEFDGNDFSATHLIGYVGEEPVGCLRIRFFADFAKIERLAVRGQYRREGLGSRLVRAAIEFCQVKGYRRIYAHSQKRFANFWSQFSFHALEGGREFVFSDFDYVEMVLDTAPHPQAIRLGADPYVIIRPEGRWHVPGILERSAIRPVTRPSVADAPERARA